MNKVVKASDDRSKDPGHCICFVNKMMHRQRMECAQKTGGTLLYLTNGNKSNCTPGHTSCDRKCPPGKTNINPPASVTGVNLLEKENSSLNINHCFCYSELSYSEVMLYFKKISLVTNTMTTNRIGSIDSRGQRIFFLLSLYFTAICGIIKTAQTLPKNQSRQKRRKI